MPLKFNPFTDKLDLINIDSGGTVVGPGTSTPGDFASFADSTGQVIADSGFNASSFLKVANNLSDLSNVPTARTNLGLGNVALLTSPVGPTNGGTGQTTYATGDMLYASAPNTLSKLAVTTNGFVLTLAGGVPTWAATSGGTVTSVSGTLNRITSTGGTTPVIDIDAGYVGQSSITTLGTISTGTWSATAIAATKGGTSQTTYATGDILYASAANTLSKLAATTNGFVLTLAAGIPSWAAASAGTVTSVSGTLNRITSTGGATPVIDIDVGYVGQSSITTLGTVTTGTWNATAIGPTFGGTNQTTYTTGDILYASTTNTLSKLAATTNGFVLTLAAGVPTWAAASGGGTVTSVSGTTNRITSTGGATPVIDISASYVGQSSITTLGTVSTGTWSATNIALNKGGTNAALTASNGGIFYSTASAGAILAGTATARQMLQSGASTTPAWSTTTYPATNAINTLLYASAANVMSALATANNGVLITSASGVPSLLAAGTTGQVLTATTSSPASWAAIPVVTANKASYKVNAGNISNVTGDGTTYTIIWDSQDALNGITYNGVTGIFTVPSAGLYEVNASVTISGLASTNTSGLLRIDISTLAYYSLVNPFAISNSYAPLGLTNGCTLFISRCLQIAANETIKIGVYVSGSSKVVSVQGQGAGGNYESWVSIVQLSQ